jgi:hypothetical protein
MGKCLPTTTHTSTDIPPMSLLGATKHAEKTPGHAWNFCASEISNYSLIGNELVPAVYSVEEPIKHGLSHAQTR